MTTPTAPPPAPAPAAAFVLWFRKTRRQRWRPIGTGPTEAAASESASCGSGAYLTRPAGRDPNHDPRPR